MDPKIRQEEAPESRPNFRALGDDMLFVYSRHRGVYEPYEPSHEKRDTPRNTSGKPLRSGLREHWRKYWTVWIPSIINFVTLIVLAVYTCYTRSQSMDAHTAVVNANRAMMLDERAWVSVSSIEPIKACDWRAITFRNSGRTMALNFHVSGAAEAVAKGTKPSKREDNFPGKGVISPDGVFSDCVGDRLIDSSDWGKTDLAIHGRITYDDIFNVSHWTSFCYLRSKNGEFVPCDTGNDTDRNGVESESK